MVTLGARSPFQPVKGGFQNKKKKKDMYSELHRQVKNRANTIMVAENLVQ